MNKALFLDRDGIINLDRHYVHTPEEFIFVPGIFDLCRRAAALGYKIIVVTNQSGIERGYFTEEEFLALTRWMEEAFLREGVTISKVYYCPTLIGDDRKPNPGMFLKARDQFALDLAKSCSLGDQGRDIEAAKRAGVGRNVLLVTGKTGDVQTIGAENVIRSLSEMENLL